MSLARLLPFLLQWTKPAGGVEHEHLPCWPLSCLGHSLRRGACAERRGGSHGLNSSLRDSTCGARTSCYTLACDGRTRASAGRVVRLGWGWTKQRRADMAWIDLPAVRAYCPPGTDALWQPRSCPSLAASEREWFTPRTLRGLARGGARRQHANVRSVNHSG